MKRPTFPNAAAGAAVLLLAIAMATPAGAASKAAAKTTPKAAPKPAAKAAPKAGAKADGAQPGMKLEGGAQGTVFGTLTVTGEDRISIQFDRPELSMSLDPRSAPGLEWGDPLAVLQRSGIDLATPFLETSAAIPSRGLSDDWAQAFREGAVVRFRPSLEDVASWRLTIVDSRSDTVAVFHGKGEPPDEIAWDGLRLDGKPAAPGFVYSYVLEAADKAGNRRTFPGNSFELPPYRVDHDDTVTQLFAASSLPEGWTARPNGAPPALLLEVASRINRGPANVPVEVRVGARSFGEAKALAEAVDGVLHDRLLGDPARIRTVTDVRSDAPKGGTVAVVASPKLAKEVPHDPKAPKGASS